MEAYLSPTAPNSLTPVSDLCCKAMNHSFLSY